MQLLVDTTWTENEAAGRNAVDDNKIVLIVGSSVAEHDKISTRYNSFSVDDLQREMKPNYASDKIKKTNRSFCN